MPQLTYKVLNFAVVFCFVSLVPLAGLLAFSLFIYLFVYFCFFALFCLGFGFCVRFSYVTLAGLRSLYTINWVLTHGSLPAPGSWYQDYSVFASQCLAD